MMTMMMMMIGDHSAEDGRPPVIFYRSHLESSLAVDL
jgi:hypothetical protein